VADNVLILGQLMVSEGGIPKAGTDKPYSGARVAWEQIGYTQDATRQWPETGGEITTNSDGTWQLSLRRNSLGDFPSKYRIYLPEKQFEFYLGSEIPDTINFSLLIKLSQPVPKSFGQPSLIQLVNDSVNQAVQNTGGGIATPALMARLGTNGDAANVAGSQAAQLRFIGEALSKPAPSLPWLSSAAFSVSDGTVTALPSIHASATQAIIQFQYADEDVRRVARSTINGVDPTQTDGWFEYNDSTVSLNTRGEVTAYRLRRLDGLGTLSGRVAYYG
jgi:hypothetical protein